MATRKNYRKRQSRKHSSKKNYNPLNIKNINIISNDYCKGEYAKDCEGNLNISRENMPQIFDVPLGRTLPKKLKQIIGEEQQEAINQILRNMLKKNKFSKATIDLLRSKTVSPLDQLIKDYNAKKTQVPLSDLIPIQKEIKKKKTIKLIQYDHKGDYVGHTSGKKTRLEYEPIIVIKETKGKKVKYYILDGHHRWSALKREYKSLMVNAYVINSNDVFKTLKDIVDLDYVFTQGFDGL